MSKRQDVQVSTTNNNLQGPDGKGLKIVVDCTADVPENLTEAAEFYGGEEKLIEAIQSDVARRRANAARPLLRDATQTLDWQSVAQQAIDAYTPGRRGGFGQPVVVDEQALRSASNMDELLEILKRQGVQVAVGGAPQPVTVGGGEEDEDENGEEQ